MPQGLRLRIRRSPIFMEELLKGREGRGIQEADLRSSVKGIVEGVRRRGDRALLDYTRRFDKVCLSSRGFIVGKEDIEDSYRGVGEEQVRALKYLRDRIAKVEGHHLKNYSFSLREEGLTIHHALKPLQSVGCYVPGGLASYPSSLLMTVVPAKVAGVPRIAVCSPPSPQGEVDPLILVAAHVCGVEEVYRLGGAQAIAALAYGTESIEPVDKIVGPGSRVVNCAKNLVSENVAIDLPAGPSELLVLADETADPSFIALDMVSQSEHAPDNVVGLITDSEDTAQAVISELEELVRECRRREIIYQSLSENGFVLVCSTLEDAVEFVNDFAPEHLEIITRDPWRVAEGVVSAGLILLGPYTPVAGSDYCFGVNHVLPTRGHSKTRSGLSVLEFVKRVNVVECSKKRLEDFRGVAMTLAMSEGLPNHFYALKKRLEGDEGAS